MGLPLLYRRNPLAFPGRAPGFDPIHPAASSAVISAISSGGNFVNLINGNSGTLTGTPTASIDGTIGATAADVAFQALAVQMWGQTLSVPP